MFNFQSVFTSTIYFYLPKLLYPLLGEVGGLAIHSNYPWELIQQVAKCVGFDWTGL